MSTLFLVFATCGNGLLPSVRTNLLPPYLESIFWPPVCNSYPGLFSVCSLQDFIHILPSLVHTKTPFIIFLKFFSVPPLAPPIIHVRLNPLNPELNPICYLLALLAHHFLHVSRIRVKSLTLRLLMSCIYGAPILDVSRSHTTTQHSR